MTAPEQAPQITMVPIDRLVLDPRIQVRPSLDDAAVREYVERYEEGGPDAMSAVEVWHVGGRYLVTDGFHRVTAARAANRRRAQRKPPGPPTVTALPAVVREGEWQDAYEAAALANREPRGVRRSPATLRAVVVRLHQLHPEWKGSRRKLAKAAGVSVMTASRAMRGTGGGVPRGTARHAGTDTLGLLSRVLGYRGPLAELLEPGAEYVARQIAQLAIDHADTPGLRSPAGLAEALREEAGAFREIAEAVEDLAARLDRRAD